jgi:hypothetical protein
MFKRMILSLSVALLAVGVLAQDAALTGPDTYPDGINPLTGLPAPDPALLERRPLIVKISNWPPEVRPQSGINDADLVWEYVVEGGVTRFAAVFYSADLDSVGPVRSARLADIPLTRIYNALLVHSGSSLGTGQRLAGGIPNRHFGVGGCPPLCRIEREGVAYEHTLYGDIAGLYAKAEEEGLDTTPEPVRGMAFGAAADGGRALDGIDIAYRETTIQWDWDTVSETWLRSQDDEPHFDALTESQLYADNVVVLEADHIDQPTVAEGYWGRVNYATDPVLTGRGRVFLLRDGVYFEGEWTRADEESPLYFVDSAGAPLPFKPGKTFVIMVPRWFNGYQLVFDLAEPLSATVTTDNANLRNGPSTNYTRIQSVPRGTALTIIGRNAFGDWLQLRFDDGTPLWVSSDIVDVDRSAVSLLPNARSTFEG